MTETLLRPTPLRPPVPESPKAAAPEPPPVRMPPPRSGAKVLAVLVAILLVFLAVLWYASVIALNSRGPDRAFLDKESWANGTLVLVVTDLDERGEVPFSLLTASIVSSSGASLYDGPTNGSQTTTNFTLTVRALDRDNSTTLTAGDGFAVSAEPPEALDALILSNFYLYSEGREWARFQIGS